MDLDLGEKLALIVGGSRGLGRAIARTLALEGARVVIAARNQEAGITSAAELADQTGGDVRFHRCDTTQSESVRALRDWIDDKGAVDVLVNCAAHQVNPPAPLLEHLDEQELWFDIDTKVFGYLRVMKEFVPRMSEAGGGRIINISGMNARLSGSIGGSLRNAAVVAASKAIADQYRSQGVSVVVVHPWVTRTERTPDFLRSIAESEGKTLDEVESDIAAGNLLGRLVTAEEIGYLVAFLASPRSVAISGDVVGAGGGIPRFITY